MEFFLQNGNVYLCLHEAVDFIKNEHSSMDLERGITEAVEKLEQKVEILYPNVRDKEYKDESYTDNLISNLGLQSFVRLECADRTLKRFDQSKKEIYINYSIDDQITDEIKQMSEAFGKLGYKIIFETIVSIDEFFTDMKKIEEDSKRFKQIGCGVQICILEYMHGQSKIASIAYNYTQEQLKLFKEFEKNNDISITFTDDTFQDEWTLKEVVKTNDEIDKIVNYIKEKEFTPYETMLYIHDTIGTKFEYNKVNMWADHSIVGPFNVGGIVCSSFTLIIKAIVDKLNMPGLKCDFYNSIIFNEYGVKRGGHCQAMIYIKDKAYKVNGRYLDDIANDAHKEGLMGPSCALCLYPISDLEFYNNLINIKQRADDRFEQATGTKKESYLNKLRIANIKRKIYGNMNSKLPTIFKTHPFSRPIPIETFVNGMYNITRGMPSVQSDEHAIEIVGEKLTDSITRAKLLFNGNAQNSFRNCENVQEALSSISTESHTKI